VSPSDRVRARMSRIWRAFWPVVIVAGGAITCDAPTSATRHVALLNVAPVLNVAAGSHFAGLTVDAARLTVIRPPADTLLQRTLAFSPDSSQLDARLAVSIAGSAETVTVTIELLAGAQVVFTGSQSVEAVAGATSQPAQPVQVNYVGPGAQLASIQIDPRDSGTVFGASVPFGVTGLDSAQNPVGQFYVSWSTNSPTHTINATGLFKAGSARGKVWVHAITPTGITDSTWILVSPVPSVLEVVSGGGQSAVAGIALSQPLVVRVIAADNGPVAGVQVNFAATSGGGSVSPTSAVTDSLGQASTMATLGSAVGSQTFTASVSGINSVSFTQTATGQPGVPATVSKASGDGQSAVAGTAVPIAPTALVVDALGSPVSGVTVQFAVASGGGSITGGTATTNGSGLASVGSWTLGSTPGANALTATVAGLTPVTFTATGLAGQPPITLTVLGTGLVGVGQQAGLRVSLGAPAPAGGVTVTVTSDSTQYLTVAAPGSLAFAQGDTAATIALNGVAAGVSIVHASATGYTAAQLPVAVTPNFITMASGVTVAVGQTTSAQITLSSPAPAGGLAVTVVSTDTTIVRTTTPTVNIAAGQSIGSASLQGVAVGTAGVTASAANYATGGTVVTVIAAGGSGITSTVVTPRLDTLTALGATRTLTAQAYDSTGAPVAGTFGWVSRVPAVATVNASGVVTAVTNGSTYVVATEAGGTKDSALIVVQQQIASVNVSPNNKNIYLTGTFTFTATAVDGLGNPVGGGSTFVWSSTAPAVALVDSTGKVTGVGLGSAQIRATTGSITGVANVGIITPITRIAVVVDTAGAAVTDTFTMTSLGLTRSYRAIAHDTLDAVMSGVTFTWLSSNGSVAVLDSITGTTARATSAANGYTEIRASAQGFTSAPGASLTVSQVLASVELKPDSAVIGVGGSVGLVARGKDANSRYIAGGTFRYASSAPSIATIDSVTGRVTGVANGVANMTATSGAITSNPSVVTVGGAVPPIISFGRDTLSVGRGGSTSIPILLSTPAASPLTVHLTVQDTFAFWSTANVTIPAGQTSVNATLNGHNAGTTIVTADDSSGLGYAGATAVLAVTATMKLTNTSYAINTTDIVQTQVLLSDPSPAGGTYVTFSYGTAGVASISPDPAFIPAGQLAADIQIRAVGAGTTTITPNAIGVNGTATNFTAYAPVLTASTTSIRLGQGQYDPNTYVYVPTYTNVPVPVTLTSSDSSVVTVPPTVTVPSSSYYAYFNITGVLPGTSTVAMASPGWTAANAVSVLVTSPYVGISGGYQIYTTNPALNVTVYAEDSLRSAHYRTNSLLVHLRSSDTTVMRVLDSTVTIAPGSYYNSTARVIPAGLGGTAWIVATASGHQPDSTQFTVIGPPLYLSWSTGRLGAGQQDVNTYYVYTPNNVTSPLTVTLANSDSSLAAAPATVTIPAGTYYVYFTMRGKAPGTSQFIATAPGFGADTANVVVTTPALTACCTTTINNFGPGTSFTVYAADTARTGHTRTTPLAVTLASTDTTVLKIDSSTVTIAAGAYYNNQAHLTPVAPGTARIVIAAAGHLALDTITITVATPKIQFSFATGVLGRGQHYGPTGVYVYTPDNRSTPLSATITQTNAAVDSPSTLTPTVPTSTYYTYFDIAGLSTGTDTLILSAPGYLPDTAVVRITTPRFYFCCLSSSYTTTNPPVTVTVYAADSLNNTHQVLDTVVVSAVSSDSTVIRPTQPSFRILPNAVYAQPTVTFVGPGTANITYSDSAGTGYQPVTTGNVTVTGPSLAFANGAPMLGMRQHEGGSYVYTPNNVASDLTVNLVSTDPRVVSVPVSVTIPAGSYYAYFDVAALDTVGTIQVQATATGYGAAAMNVQVTQPKFVISAPSQTYTTSGPQYLYVYTADANGTYHLNSEDVVVTLASSAPSVAAIDSLTVTIPTDQYYSAAATWLPGLVGTAQLSATDTRAALYKYNTATQNVQVLTPYLYFDWSTRQLGIGQYDDYAYVATPDYQAGNLAVAFQHLGTARTITYDNLTTTVNNGVTIPQGNYYQYFRIYGASAGTDTLVASATSPAHVPDTAYTVVSPGRVDPIVNWPTAVAVGDSVAISLYTRDANQTIHPVRDATTFTLAPNANIQFWSGGANSTQITSVTVPAGQQFVTFYVKGVAAGTGSVQITNANYSTYSTTVTVQ